MKQKVLSLFLCVCLMLPMLAVCPFVSAEENEEGYLLHRLKYKITTATTISGSGVLFSPGGITFDPLDITAMGYSLNSEENTLGLQFDVYTTGDDDIVTMLESGQLNGQIELASGGVYDQEETSRSLNGIKFERNVWKRVVLPLSTFTEFTSTQTEKEFDPTRVNFFRIYADSPTEEVVVGQMLTVKMVNFYLVDMAKEAPTEEEVPLGDGSFIPDAPQWKPVTFAEGYEAPLTVAGYNVKEYMESHDLSPIDPETGLEDYSVIFESLLNGLQIAGGGTLFVPAGEYAFRSTLILPDGVNIMGEWKNPDKSPKVDGTVFKVYEGAGETDGVPFITMQHHALIENVAFWYPEQLAESVTVYPPTISMTNYAFVRNVTFVNSYVAVKMVGGNCPNVYNIYGTPLSIGLDVDNIIDIARNEEIHFAADYWIASGLVGAPTDDAAQAMLREWLYYYGTGMVLRRLDFSYTYFVDVRGYNAGIIFDTSLTIDGYFPNGSCHGIVLTDCKYGVITHGISTMGMQFSDTVITNCEYGFYTPSNKIGANGSLKLWHTTIDADVAIHHEGNLRLQVVESTVKRGTVMLAGNVMLVANTTFMTAAPQIVLDYNAGSAIMVGNTNKNGGEITYENRGHCPVSYDVKPMELEEVESITAEEAAPLEKGPATDAFFLVDNLDASGETDVTEGLQTWLTAAGNVGGGLVYLPAGRYRIDGSLVIPTGVELRGSQDIGTTPQYGGTLLQVYRRGDENSQATINMQMASGLRGVVVNYPEQTSKYTVDEEGTYEFEFISYPYLIRGQGRDIYIISVSAQNGWNGVDLKTNRCNNHYIDAMGGHFYNRAITIGNGARGGIIRNYQFNYNAIYQAYNSTWGSWPCLGEQILTEHFLVPMHKQFNTSAVMLELGNVNDELVYNCFNYAGYAATRLVEENGEAANARFIGFSADHTTVCVDVFAAEKVTFLDSIFCGYDRHLVSGQDVYDIWLHEGADCRVVFTNICVFGENASASACVEGGTLQLNNMQINTPFADLFKMGEKGTLYLNAVSWGFGGNPHITAENLDRVFWNGAFYADTPVSTEGVGAFKNALKRVNYRSVPRNVLFTEDSEIVFSESFDSYELTESSKFQADNLKFATIRRGAVRVRLTAAQLMNGVKTGQDEKQAVPFALESGSSDDLYRMEWRINIAEIRDMFDSEIYVFLSNADAKNQQMITVQRDGTMLDQTGKQMATLTLGTDYRLAIEVDARDADNKTATIYLLNDDSRVLAKGTTAKMNDIFQGENTVTGFWLAAMASPIDVPESETDFTLDYFYITRSEKSSIGRNVDPNSVLPGDVNGDNKVDSTDARLVLQRAVGKISTLPIPEAADVNGDNKVDSTDARLILQHAVGKIKEFPTK